MAGDFSRTGAPPTIVPGFRDMPTTKLTQRLVPTPTLPPPENLGCNQHQGGGYGPRYCAPFIGAYIAKIPCKVQEFIQRIR